MMTKLLYCAALALGLAATLTRAINVDQAVIDAIVDGHNKLRKDTGANMALLAWSGTLAQYAQTRTDACLYQHDSTRKYGENLYASWGNSLSGVQAGTNAVNTWGAEISRADPPTWNCAFTTDQTTTCGHYSQQVWADTKQVGCGISECSGSMTLVFCEYDPPGNMMAWDWDTMSAVPAPPY